MPEPFPPPKTLASRSANEACFLRGAGRAAGRAPAGRCWAGRLLADCAGRAEAGLYCALCAGRSLLPTALPGPAYFVPLDAACGSLVPVETGLLCGPEAGLACAFDLAAAADAGLLCTEGFVTEGAGVPCAEGFVGYPAGRAFALPCPGT